MPEPENTQKMSIVLDDYYGHSGHIFHPGEHFVVEKIHKDLTNAMNRKINKDNEQKEKDRAMREAHSPTNSLNTVQPPQGISPSEVTNMIADALVLARKQWEAEREFSGEETTESDSTFGDNSGNNDTSGTPVPAKPQGIRLGANGQLGS